MKKCFTILFLIYTINFAQYSSWEYQSIMPKPVAGGEVWNNADNLFVIGGYSDSVQTNVNWVQKYNVYSKEWEYGSINIPRFGFVLQEYNNLAYILGGVEDEANSLSGIERWGIDFTDEGTFSYNDNFNRKYSTGQIVGDNFYIIGGNPLPGTRPDTLPYLIEYNIPTANVTFQIDTLFISEDFPEQQMSEVIGDNIYIFGGVYYTVSQDIYRFNVITHEYEKLNIKLLEPRAGGKAIFVPEENLIYIIGGYNEDSPALSSVEIFSINNGNFEIVEGPPLQEARYNLMAGNSYGSIYVFGGFNSEKEVVNSIESLFTLAVVEVNSDAGQSLPSSFKLYQNYPNPFNPSTTIKFAIPELNQDQTIGSDIIIKIYDVIGNEIEELIKRECSPGVHEIRYNASKLTSGIYYYQLKSENFVQTKKMILVK